MEKPFLFPDEIAEELRLHVVPSSVVRLECDGEHETYTLGHINYGLYASDQFYIDSHKHEIFSERALALRIYDVMEDGGHAYIDDTLIQ